MIMLLSISYLWTTKNLANFAQIGVPDTQISQLY